ncbi:MAG: hypothetical protein ACK2UA_10515 [Anaerolineae bacterium]|jgi:hypothetical protein
MKTKLLILSLGLALFLVAAGVTLANDAVELPRWVLGGGASDSGGGGGLALQATLGQPVVGLVAGGGGEITLGQGFWHGGSLPEGLHYVYLPLVEK